jgi:hypothetical protein
MGAVSESRESPYMQFAPQIVASSASAICVGNFAKRYWQVYGNFLFLPQISHLLHLRVVAITT